MKSLLLACLIFLVYGCSPQDDHPLPADPTTVSEKFYAYQGTDQWVNQMISVMQQKYSYVIPEALYEKYGYAQWELAAKGPAWSAKPGNEAAGASENEEEPEFYPEVIVPMVHEHTQRVNGLLGWRRLPDGTDIVRVFDRDTYEGLSRHQQMEQQPRLVAGYFLAFESQLYNRQSLTIGEFRYTFEDPLRAQSPGWFGWSCTIVRSYDANTGQLIGEWWYNCEDYTVTIVSDVPWIEPEIVTADPHDPVYYDPTYADNGYYSSGGGGSTTDYSYDPTQLDPEDPFYGDIPELNSNYEAIVDGPVSPTLNSVENYMTLVASEFVKHEDTRELGYSLYEVADDDCLDVNEKINLAIRARSIFLKLHASNFNIDILNQTEQTQLAQDAALIDLYPEVKRKVEESGWPLSGDEWEALWNIMQPMLGELLLEALPGGGLTLAFRDLVEGAGNADVLLITTGIISLILEVAPPGKFFKAIFRGGRIVRSVFKMYKLARKHLIEIGQAAKRGKKARVDGNAVVVSDGPKDVAKLTNNVMEFNYSGFGGKITTNPDKTTTVIGKWRDPAGGGTSEIIESGLSKSGKNKGGLNALDEDIPPSMQGNDNAIWDNVNEPWLKQATDRGDVIRVVSNPNDLGNLYKNGDINQGLSFFGREVEYLKSKGYRYNPINYTFYK